MLIVTFCLGSLKLIGSGQHFPLYAIPVGKLLFFFLTLILHSIILCSLLRKWYLCNNNKYFKNHFFKSMCSFVCLDLAGKRSVEYGYFPKSSVCFALHCFLDRVLHQSCTPFCLPLLFPVTAVYNINYNVIHLNSAKLITF